MTQTKNFTLAAFAVSFKTGHSLFAAPLTSVSSTRDVRVLQPASSRVGRVILSSLAGGGNGGEVVGTVSPTTVVAPPAGDISTPTAPHIGQKSPAATYEAALTAAVAKAEQPWMKTLLLGIIAGAYVGMGALLALRVGGSVDNLASAYPGLQRLLFGAIGLPTGLMLVLTAGGELFTGNTMIMSAGVLSRCVNIKALLRNWSLSYIGNLIGALLAVKLVLACGVLTGAASGSGAAMAIAGAKTSIGFKKAFLRGLVCNWLVCLAVYLANGASDLVSKFIAIVAPISAFVAMGMEHSVANMFLIPMGIACGASVGVKAFLLSNLLPVTLGNIVAGVFLVAGVYYLSFGRK